MAGPFAETLAGRDRRSDGIDDRLAEHKLGWIRRTDVRTKWLERSLMKAVGPPLERWWDELRAKTKRAVGEGLLSPPPLPFPADVREAFMASMRGGIAHGYANGYRLVQKLYRTVARKRVPAMTVKLDDAPPPGWESSARVQDVSGGLGSFANGDPASYWRDVVPEEALQFLNGYTPQLAGVLERDCLDRVNRAITESLKGGLTVPERMMRVSGVLNDLDAFPAHRLAAIARTESLRAYNLGNLSAAARLYGRNRLVEGVEFSAILDSRTTDVCRRRDGLRMRMDDPDLARNTPPLHPNCRSVLIPIVWGEAEEGWASDPEWRRAMEEEPSMMRDTDLRAVRDVLGAAMRL